MFPSVTSVGTTGPIPQLLVGAFRGEELNFAPTVAPPIPVAQPSGKIKVIASAPFLRTDAKKRAPGGEYTEKEAEISEISFATDEWAIRSWVPRELFPAAVPSIDVDELGTRLVAEDLATRWMSEIAPYTVSGSWGAGITHETTPVPKWDVATGLPITDVGIGRRYVHGRIHKNPNVLLLGYSAREYLNTNPQVLAALPDNAARVVEDDFLARIFRVDRVVTAGANYVSSVQGQPNVFAPIIDKVALLLYVKQNPQPGMMSPGALYTLFWDKTVSGPNGVASMAAAIVIEKWWEQNRRRWAYDADSQFQVKQADADSGYLFLAVGTT